jgi:PAS domain S-box-containing protein
LATTAFIRRDTIRSVIIQNILESVPVGLLVVDPDGEIILCNSAASRILEYERQAIEGKGWAEIFFDSEENTAFNDVIVDVIWKQRVNLRREVSYLTPTGAVRHLSTTSSFLLENDEIAGIVILLDDVTDIYQMQQREKAMLEEKNRIQSERAESLKKLALGVAHEIRNPTVFIGGFANRMLKQADERSPFPKYLENILSGTKRLENIVVAVRDYADISAIVPTEVPVTDIVEKAQENLKKETALLSKQIDWRIQLEPVELAADPDLLAEALAAVLRNGLESIRHEPGVIEISSGREGNATYIEVSDTGAGISEKDLPFVFDPFFSSKADGIGMGLPSAQRIMAEHGGEIRIDSTPGEGTKVRLSLSDHRGAEKGSRSRMRE